MSNMVGATEPVSGMFGWLYPNYYRTALTIAHMICSVGTAWKLQQTVIEFSTGDARKQWKDKIKDLLRDPGMVA